ncbi:MAG: hypothetical protein ACOX55_09110 [Christensenellales bacterium]
MKTIHDRQAEVMKKRGRLAKYKPRKWMGLQQIISAGDLRSIKTGDISILEEIWEAVSLYEDDDPRALILKKTINQAFLIIQKNTENLVRRLE